MRTTAVSTFSGSSSATRLLGLGLLAVLAGCGGGGGSGSAPAPAPGSDVSTIAQAVGDYDTGCARNATGQQYRIVQATVTDAGGGFGRAVVHYRSFGVDSACKPEALIANYTATLKFRPLAETKAITTVEPGGSILGTARVAEATLESIRISLGTFTGNLPVPGVTTKVGYMAHDGGHVFVQGGREADGLGSHFSSVVLKKR